MAPNILIDLMRSDPMAWLWDTQVQVELFALLGPLWKRASEAERNELVGLVLEGMPRDRFRNDMEPAEWDRMNAWAVWERLARIERDGGQLPDPAASRLAEIRERFPEWELTGEPKEDFATWSETRYGYPTDIDAATLRELATNDGYDEVFYLLTTGEHNREGRLRQWEGVVGENPAFALPVLRWMGATKKWDREVLMWTLQGASEAPGKIPLEDWAEALRLVPEHSWGSALHPASRALERLVISADPNNLERILALWDHAFWLSLENGKGIEGGDLLNAAINLPAGKLAGGLLDFAVRVLTEGSEIPPSVMERIEHVLLTADNPAYQEVGAAARVPVYARLSMFAAADAQWTATHLVPRLDWARPEEARLAWEGLMWSPRIGPELWEHVEPHAREACRHYQDIGRGRSSLPGLLVSKYIDELPPASDDLRDCLRSVDDAGRIATVRYVAGLLRGADSKSGELWRTRVRRLFVEAWPREAEYRSSALTVEMAGAAIRAGEAFPDAAQVVGDLMTPTNSPGMPLRWLQESRHPEDHPAAVVTLLGHTLVPTAALRHSPLPGILTRVRAAGAEVPPVLADSAQRG